MKGGITEAKGESSGVEDNCRGIRSGGEDGDDGKQQQTGESARVVGSICL